MTAAPGGVTPASTTLEVAGRSVHPEFGTPARDDALGGWYRGWTTTTGRPGRSSSCGCTPGC
ncbi:hypothetical protein [Symbioplanes lichenis]|uniref:hypothetical protein n=1 Tax=Symbioplanes lichenis TaxID=1629072 RepID=UPI002738CAD9|nr:hypothetical protein [Actinoplanes lichenis]